MNSQKRIRPKPHDDSIGSEELEEILDNLESEMSDEPEIDYEPSTPKEPVVVETANPRKGVPKSLSSRTTRLRTLPSIPLVGIGDVSLGNSSGRLAAVECVNSSVSADESDVPCRRNTREIATGRKFPAFLTCLGVKSPHLPLTCREHG